MEVVYKRLTGKRPTVSFVLLDWSCRESFHSLDYLAQQNVARDDYEIIWIEYYKTKSDPLNAKIAEYTERAASSPVDLWLVMGMDRSLYYHKHLMYNIGIAQSRGDIVIICDSDAMFPANFVETVISTFEENPRSVVHFDEVRNSRQEFYPFNYPSFEELLGPGVINWRNGKTTGLWDSDDPLHSRNYGACFCARRDDLIEIGGADEHLDYLGHVCGPYELTFRLVNKGLREIWHDRVFIYHTWHPGSDGDFNYIGPSDGRHMSTTALEARESGRVMPLLENAAIRALREGKDVDPTALIDPSYAEAWTEEAVSRSPRFKLFKQGEAGSKLVMTLSEHNIVLYGGEYYGVPHILGPLDLAKPEDRALPGIVKAQTLDAAVALLRDAAAEPAPAVAVTGATATAAEIAAAVAEIAATVTEPANPATAAEPEPRSAIPAAADTLAARDEAGSAAPLSLPPAVQGGATGATIVPIVDELLKIVAQRQIDREAQHQRVVQLEKASEASRAAFDRLHAAVARKDQLIAALQDQIAREERQRATLKREAEHWRDHVLCFRGSLDLLPLLQRKTFAVDSGASVLVTPNSEQGHFLFGPYLPLQAGSYALSIRYRASRVEDRGQPILSVEIADGGRVLAAQAVSGEAADRAIAIAFDVPAANGRAEGVEFRFSHHANATLEILAVDLSAAPRRAANAGRPRGWFARLWRTGAPQWTPRIETPAPIGRDRHLNPAE